MCKNVRIIETEGQLKNVNGYLNKEILYVLDSYVFKFPCKYIRVDVYLKLRGQKFKENFLNIFKKIKLDELDAHKNRIQWPWQSLGNYKWIYAAILGIVSHKKVIIYPYIRKEEMAYRVVRLNLLIQVIKEQNLLLIVPVEKGTDISQLKIE